MAGKITIRRVGTLLPHLCLVGLLAVVGLIIWLSTVGIPDCALRYIEAEAAKAGIPVRIEKIQLVPRAGLAVKAEGISLGVPQPELPESRLYLRKAQLAFSLSRLLAGDWTPQDLKLKGGQIEIPVGEQETLQVTDIDIYFRFLRQFKGVFINTQNKFYGIALQTHFFQPIGNLSKVSSHEDSTPRSETDILAQIGQQLAEFRPWLVQVQQELAAQNWDDSQHPVINLKAREGNNRAFKLEAWIPSFNKDLLHARDIALEASFEDETITIETLRFHTINPSSTLSLQGAYNIDTRELAFNTRSSAPLVRVIEKYLGDDFRLLHKINSPKNNTPTIKLDGRIVFAEDYALNSITLRGKLEHELMHLGKTQVNHLVLSFFLRDGSFNIDNLLLEFPNGHIRASAQAANGKGNAKLDLNLPDETLLALAQDFSNEASFTLPEELRFDDNLKLRANCTVSVPLFEPGKTQFKDLIPTLRSCDILFNTEHIAWKDSEARKIALTLHADGIELNTNSVSIDDITVDGLLGSFSDTSLQASADNFIYNLKLSQLNTPDNYNALTFEKADFRISLEAARMRDSALDNFHTTASLGQFHAVWADIAHSLCSQKIEAEVQINRLEHEQTKVQTVHANVSIPRGLNMADGWNNMQKDAVITASINEIRQNGSFCINDTKLDIRNTGKDECRLNFSGTVSGEPLHVNTTAALRHNRLLLLNNTDARLPLASMAPLMGGEPLQEVKLPREVVLHGDALIDTESGRLIKTHYDISVPELIRVCQNVHVHKGMEIPLTLQVQGEFGTAEDGTMQYDAKVQATHKLGTLDIHVKGNPLKDCYITGSNTIPVNVVNALIDNVDAHWIMRDFRCQDGVTRSDVSDINATIRYDKGFYMHTLCKAHLQNMEFLLGALRDKYDANGNETGEEYLRTDLSRNPYTLVKEGRCDVEVLVQLDCTDEQGAPLPERIRINLTNPDLLYDNRPWLKRMGFKTGATTSRISGEAVRFNIEDMAISLHKLKGKCYPAYSIGMYYAPIQHYMEDIILRDPVDIATDYCIFPLSRRSKVEMKGLIRADGATGAGFRFLGTTIPFNNFNGFINISDTDVFLDRMNAQCWGGAMSGALRIGFSGKHTSLDGYVEAQGMNLKDIVASYGADFTPASCSGYIRFQAPEPELEKVIAYGQVSLKDGDLMQISLFRPIESLLSDMPGHLSKLQKSVKATEETAPPSWADKLITFVFDSGSGAVDTVQDSSYKMPFVNHFLRYGIDEAFARFDIRDGHLITRGMKAKGYNLNVDTQLDIDLDKLTVKGDLWPKISSVPTVLISPITILSKFLIDINIHGELADPQWEFGLSKKFKSDESSLSPEPQKKETETRN